MEIREVEKQDNEQIEALIRTCLIEFGANKPGCAWEDPDLGRFYELYQAPRSKYWVAVENNQVIAGCGIGPYGVNGVCELQKMYCSKDYRGTGLGHQLMEKALTYAKKYYTKCYLETFANMQAANRFYINYGFISLDKPLIPSQHYACDRWYILDL